LRQVCYRDETFICLQRRYSIRYYKYLAKPHHLRQGKVGGEFRAGSLCMWRPPVRRPSCGDLVKRRCYIYVKCRCYIYVKCRCYIYVKCRCTFTWMKIMRHTEGVEPETFACEENQSEKSPSTSSVKGSESIEVFVVLNRVTAL
jgi:hypothetical protein